MSVTDRRHNSILPPQELSVFSRELCALLRAGMDLATALALVGKECLPHRAALMDALAGSLENGLSLDKAMTDSHGFPGHYCHMIAIAQLSGRLEQVLGALADYYEQQHRLRLALRRAVAYPAVMLVVTLAVLLVLLSQVLPIFQQVLSQLGAELPPMAQTLLRAGAHSQVLAGVFFALVALLALAALFFRCTPPGRRLSPRLMQKTILRGALGLSLARRQFADALALMLTSGLHPDAALEQCQGLLEGTPLAEAIAPCRQALSQGTPLAESCRQSGLLDTMQAGLLSAGMLSGDGDEAVRELAERCRSQADELLERTLGRVEPAMLLVLTVAIGFILLSVMLPLLGMMTALGS